MVCAGLGCWGAPAEATRWLLRFGPLGSGAGSGDSPRFADESIPVSTDDSMMASMAGRYAAALYELAREQQQLEQVERDVLSF